MAKTRTKRCTRCGVEKPLTGFLKNRRYKGGYQTWCRACFADVARQWRRAHPQRFRDTLRRYRKRHADYWRSYRRRPECRRKDAARMASFWAARTGVLVQPDACEHCGRKARKVALQRHHPDYNQPLNVVWLCHGCHMDEHCRLRAEARGTCKKT